MATKLHLLPVALLLLMHLVASHPVIELPDGYEWLETELIQFGIDGTTPQLTDAQWSELRMKMKEQHFNWLTEILLNGFETRAAMPDLTPPIEQVENLKPIIESGKLAEEGGKKVTRTVISVIEEKVGESSVSTMAGYHFAEGGFRKNPADADQLYPEVLRGWKRAKLYLALTISLPIAGFLLLVAIATCIACKYRKRRQQRYNRFDHTNSSLVEEKKYAYLI